MTSEEYFALLGSSQTTTVTSSGTSQVMPVNGGHLVQVINGGSTGGFVTGSQQVVTGSQLVTGGQIVPGW